MEKNYEFSITDMNGHWVNKKGVIVKNPQSLKGLTWQNSIDPRFLKTEPQDQQHGVFYYGDGEIRPGEKFGEIVRISKRKRDVNKYVVQFVCGCGKKFTNQQKYESHIFFC